MLTDKQMRKTRRTADGHLLWTGGLANGRPAVKRENRTVYVKRLLWQEIHGPIPEGAVVVSTCGKRTCIEPGHLSLSGPGRYAGSRDALAGYAVRGEKLD